MSYQYELRHLKYFHALAETLHYRKAAENLFISQPGLSRQIKELEEKLGVALFERTKRQVSLTTAGTYLKEETEYIFGHLHRVEKRLRRIAAGEWGEIKIGFLGSAMQQVVPNLLLAMNATYPDLHANLEEMSNGAQVEAIEKEDLDLGFVRLDKVPASIHRQPIFQDSFSLVLPADHSLTQSNFRHVGQVAQENFILFSSDYSPAYYEKILSICEDQGFTPKISHKSVHAQTIFKLVELGLGIAIVPSSLQYGYQLKVKFLEIPNIHQVAQLSVIWKEGNRNPVLSKVLDLLMPG
ncbi:MAG: LysR substrate-binding domain-containing protein [Bacteroidota bacterium]